MLADNKLALNAGWDQEILAIELQGLIDLGFDVEATGFTLGEIEVVLEEAANSDPNEIDDGAEDEIPAVRDAAVSRMGDVWQAGRHRLVCGDARDPKAYEALLGQDQCGLIFTDPPYNVPIDGHVCGSGRIGHREFAMGVGEMSPAEFRAFLEQTLALQRTGVATAQLPSFYGLAARGRASCGRQNGLHGAQERLRVEQDQCRYGKLLSFEA